MITLSSYSETRLELVAASVATLLIIALASFASDARAEPPVAREARLHPHDIGARRQRRLHAAGSVMSASWYGGRGERLNAITACGVRFRPDGLTAAHRTLPCGTNLLVSRAGRSVVVAVTDRGPAKWTGRSLDLSRGAAARLAMLRIGVAPVRVAIIGGW